MAKLEGFRDKDYLEQVLLLNEISEEKDQAELDGLVDLLKNPVGDAAVDRMVVNALNHVLSRNEEAVVSGIGDDHAHLRLLCIQFAGEYGFKGAVEPLCALAETEEDPDILTDILSSLSKIRQPGALPVFQRHLMSDDPYVQALCIEMIGAFQDEESLHVLTSIIDESDRDDRYQQCDLTTWKAVESVAAIANDMAISNLVFNLHHRNPTVRRIITDELTKLGEAAVPYLADVFRLDNVDEKILAANILGFIGHKSGADAVIEAMDRGVITDPNVKYACYEALGRIGTMKGIIALMDGLNEDDELILMAVATGLDRHVNPGMVKTLTQMLEKGDDKAHLLARSIVSAKATALFEALYANESVADMLMEHLVQSKDAEVIDAFRTRLESMGGDRAKADMARLPTLTEDASAKQALAADDSKSMLGFYRAILTNIGVTPTVEPNGLEAFRHIEAGRSFDVIITDMNMPVMDGMQLVEKVRGTPGFEETPIIMVTTESEASQRKLAEDTGVTAFITKPFKPEELEAMVTRLLG